MMQGKCENLDAEWKSIDGVGNVAAVAISSSWVICDKTMRIEYNEYNVFYSDDVNGSKQKHSGNIKPHLRAGYIFSIQFKNYMMFVCKTMVRAFLL